MKIDVQKIEQQIYFNICENFANWCEYQLKQYESLLQYLDTITLEEMLNESTKIFYENYKNFCTIKSLDILPTQTLATIMTSIGYPATRKTINHKQISCYSPR